MPRPFNRMVQVAACFAALAYVDACVGREPPPEGEFAAALANAAAKVQPLFASCDAVALILKRLTTGLCGTQAMCLVPWLAVAVASAFVALDSALRLLGVADGWLNSPIYLCVVYGSALGS